MSVALTCLAVFLAVAAAGSFFLFVVVRRHAVALWVLVNTCSPVSLLYVILYGSGHGSASAPLSTLGACFAAGMMFFYGASGLLYFGWPRDRAVLIPQIGTE